MKNLKSIFLALIAVCASLFLATSCGEEEKFDAYEIEGTYIGKLSLNGTTIEDVYSVTVQAISKSAVTVYADFYSSGSERYNVTYNSNSKQYIFSSETASNINIVVSDHYMNLTFLNNAGSMTLFEGYRD